MSMASEGSAGGTLVVHLLSGLEIGGKERVALQLARQGLREGGRHEMWLFDTPYRSPDIDLDPAPVPTGFVPRRPGWDTRFIRMLAGQIRTRRVGVIHAHNDTALCYAALASALVRFRAQRPTLIATFHTWPTHSTARARRVTRLAATQADGVAAVSDDLARRLTQSGWLSRCRTIWNGVDLDEFSPVGDDGDTNLGDLVADSDAPSPEDVVLAAMERTRIEGLLNHLDDRSAGIMRARYGLEDGREHSLTEVATRFSLSRERIRQLEIQALGRLRELARAEGLQAA